MQRACVSGLRGQQQRLWQDAAAFAQTLALDSSAGPQGHHCCPEQALWRMQLRPATATFAALCAEEGSKTCQDTRTGQQCWTSGPLLLSQASTLANAAASCHGHICSSLCRGRIKDLPGYSHWTAVLDLRATAAVPSKHSGECSCVLPRPHLQLSVQRKDQRLARILALDSSAGPQGHCCCPKQALWRMQLRPATATLAALRADEGSNTCQDICTGQQW